MTKGANEIFDRVLLQRRRERFRGRFTEHDFLLRRVAQDFGARLETIKRDFDLALDLGSHHGIIADAINSSARVGTIIRSDASHRVICAQNGIRAVADEEFLPFATASLDLVVSGLSLHHVNDVPGTLVQIRRMLKPDGLFLGAVLGGRTLGELREALAVAEEDVSGGVSPRVAPFGDVRDYGALLQRAGFALPVCDSDVVATTYETPFHLMREIRGMGAGNVLHERRRTPPGRRLFQRMGEIYEERFSDPKGRVRATFEIIHLSGWAPDESQQKPLKPGSAKMRLADALGTDEIAAGEKADPRARRD